jgi:SSS family solute:Na+ symporter
MIVASVILFVIYLAILIGMGLKQAQKNATMESYWLAERNLPAYRIGFCLAASWFGLSSFTGQAGWVYGEGLGSLFYLAIPNFVAIFLIGVIFSKRIRQIPALSQPEFLEMRYSRAIRPLLAIVILIAFAGYAAMEFIALEYVFETFLGWTPWIGAVIIVVVTLIYVNLGGMNTVVWTEVVQYCLLFLVGAIVAIAGIVKGIDMINAGEVAGVAPGTSIWSIPTLGEDAQFGWWSIFSLGIGTTIMLIVAYWPAWSTEQSPWQRIWMAQDTKTGRKGAFYGTAMNAVVYFFSILMAVAAWVIIGAPADQAADFNTELIVYYLMTAVLPTWIIPIVIVGFFAAAMSNISNFATSAASNLAKDIYQRYMRPHATQREMVWVSRICIAITLLMGVFVGMVMPSILDTVVAAASIATCGYFVPIVGALFWRRGNTQGAVASMILGGGGYLVSFIGINWGGWVFPCDPVIIFVIVAFFAYVIVSLVTGKPETKKLVGFFKEDAAKFVADWHALGLPTEPTAESMQFVDSNVVEKTHGERYMYAVTYKLSHNIKTVEEWQKYCDKLLKNQSWVWLAGYDIIYKITQEDMLSNIRLARGQREDEVLIYCEPTSETAAVSKKSIAMAVDDLKQLA